MRHIPRFPWDIEREISRPCPCGSGTAYGECCNRTQPIEPLVDSEIQAFRMESEGYGPQGRPIWSAIMPDGRRMRFLGRRVVKVNARKTFHEFILDTLKFTLGKDWLFSERKKLPSERHQIAKWFCAFWELQERVCSEQDQVDGRWTFEPTGDVLSLFALAYDIYQLWHTENVSRDTIARLKKYHEFQAARYEIAVAAMFARLLWRLDYTVANPAEKHGEFVATHTRNGIRVAVEAKSRRRAGIFHQQGESQQESPTGEEVGQLVKRALKQSPTSLPFLIFVDINAPPQTLNNDWIPELDRILNKCAPRNEDGTDLYNAVFLTNLAFHYRPITRPTPPQYLSIASLRPRHSFPMQYIKQISAAIESYGLIPDDSAYKLTGSPGT